MKTIFQLNVDQCVKLLYKMTHALQMGSSEATLPHDKSSAGQSLNDLQAKTTCRF